ncbi:MAG: EAL domain-containing protein [Rhodoferax sp.]|nr:EAL domain-containing protein [Rhodoferax sp.]
MPPTGKPREDLARELKDLRERLAEAEETLWAIRNGAVDALIVAGPQGDRVFTLEDANTPYRVFIEQMNEGALSLSESGTILYCNRRFAELLSKPLDQVIGAAFDAFLAPGQGTAWAALLQATPSGRSEGEVGLRRDDGTLLPVHLSLNRPPPASVGIISIVATDLTERNRAEERERQHTQVAHINRVLQMLTANAPLASVLDTIVRDLESLNPAMLCSILLLDNDGKQLRQGAAPSLPDFFNEAIAGLAIGHGVGSCGTAAFTGQRVVVEEIETHAFWTPYRDLARRAGLGACWSQPILSEQGQVLGTFAVYHRQAYQPTAAGLQLIEDEAHLAAIAIEKTTSESRLQLAANVFTHAREGIIITDATGTIIEVNAAFSLLTGYSRDEALGQNPRMLQSGRQVPEFYAAMWKALTDKGHWYGELWNRRKSGELFAEMLTISAVRDAAGQTQNYVALFTDITLQKEHQNQLERMAHYDALTGLPNRLLLADRMQQGIVQCQRREHSLAVAYLDLDHFKEINDKYGHTAGDTLLIELSQRMKEALREGDSLARIGGDEFVAILVDLEQAQDCYPVLERLLRAAASSVAVRAGIDQDGNVIEAVLQTSASIGVTIFPKDGTDADQLLRHADQAMYLAKDAGKNRYHLFDVAQDAAIQTQHDSLEQIRLALDHKEFVLFYQPKVNLRTGAVVGAEALIRWQHPERDLLAPSLFLHIIEDDPLNVELGEWVITSALSQMGHWKTGGLDIPVSVNISARQLQDPNFTARLSALLLEHPDVEPNCLELEVLETSALADIVHVSQIMRACQALGVHFSLDDFGTGYSSLTYLRRLPAEVLKIDQSFVCDMLQDPDDLAIVQGVVGLASAFHRGVIAEGVETAAHGKLLLSIGCELAQGYGIDKPMPAADFPDWMANWHSAAVWAA